MSDHSPDADAGREPDPERIVTPQEFGRELTLLRHRADLTVRQVAKAAGLPVSTAGDYFSRPALARARPRSWVTVAAQDPGRLRGDGSRPARPVDGRHWLERKRGRRESPRH